MTRRCALDRYDRPANICAMMTRASRSGTQPFACGVTCVSVPFGRETHGRTRLEVDVQVVALAQLEHSAKAVVVNLKHVKQAHDGVVLHALHDAVLARLPGHGIASSARSRALCTRLHARRTAWRT